MMPSLPGASFVMIQTQLIFELLVALLDPPADLGEANETQKTGVISEVGKPELRWGYLILRPFHQQPECLFFCSTTLVTMAGQHTCRAETAGHRSLGTLAPGDSLPAFLGPTLTHLSHAYRSAYLQRITPWPTTASLK